MPRQPIVKDEALEMLNRLIHTYRLMISQADQLVGNERRIMRKYTIQLNSKIRHHPLFQKYLREKEDNHGPKN